MISDEANRREVAGQMAEAATAWLDTLDSEQRPIGQGAVPADDPTDNERRRWFYTRPTTVASPSISSGPRSSGHDAAGVDRTLPCRVRHSFDDHGSGERPRLRGGVQIPLQPGTRSRPGMYYLRVFGEPV
jgi:hypothetical protein